MSSEYEITRLHVFFVLKWNSISRAARLLNHSLIMPVDVRCGMAVCVSFVLLRLYRSGQQKDRHPLSAISEGLGEDVYWIVLRDSPLNVLAREYYSER